MRLVDRMQLDANRINIKVNPISKSGGNMPTVKPDESEKEFMNRCVPIVMGEGATQQQALGKCSGIYQNTVSKKKAEMLNKMAKAIKTLAEKIKE